MCGEVIYPGGVGLPGGPQNIAKNIPSAEAAIREGDEEELVSYHLDPEKEEEVKILLKTASVREIVARTGVAKATITRIRNENLAEGERAELKRRANVKGRNKRELEREGPKTDLQNDGRNIPKNIPSTDRGGKGGQEIMTEQTQVCTNPKCPKPNPQLITEFNKNAARPSGHDSRCRTCTTQAQRDRKAAIEKASTSGTGRSRKTPGNGRRKRQPRNPRPIRLPPSGLPSAKSVISEAVTLDAQLLKAVKKSAVLNFVKNDLPRMVEESFG